jgi:hypothetical protein
MTFWPRSMRFRASCSVSQTLSWQYLIPHSQRNGSLPSLSGRTTARILWFRLRARAEADRTNREARGLESTAVDTCDPSDQDPQRGRDSAPVAEKPNRLVEINLAAATQYECISNRITGLLQLVEPPAPHLVSPDHAPRQSG